MLGSILIFWVFISAVRAIGELSFPLIPSTITLSGTSQVDSFCVGDIILAALGYAVSMENPWPGMQIKNPVELGSTSVMVLYVNGIFSIPSINQVYQTFPLMESDIDQSLDYVSTQLANGTVRDFNFCNHDEGVAAFRAHFSSPFMDEALPLEHDNSDEYFQQNRFMEDVAYIDSISQHLAQFLKQSHVLIIRISVESVMKSFTTVNDPRGTIESMVENLRIAASNLQSSVLFMIATNKGNTLAAIRSQTPGHMHYPFEDIGKDSNLPVVIQISVWLTLALTLLIVTAGYYLATIEPGKDSINYSISSYDISKKRETRVTTILN